MSNRKPKIAFPHLGTIYVVWASIIKSLGGDVIVPPYTNKKTLSLGTKHSPEAICLPYKLVLGNFIEAIEKGADTVIMISSPGICRLGEYGNTVKNVLRDLGYKAKYMDLDLYKGFKAMYDCMIEITGVRNPIKIIKALNVGIRKVFVLDRLENKLSYYRAREEQFGQAELAHTRGVKWVYEASTIKELKAAEKAAMDELAKTTINSEKEVLHVDLTGEIFMVLDPFSNQNLERELGKLGVQTRRSLTISSWLKDAIIPKFFTDGETHLERSHRFARPYLSRDIGGDALESVSDVVSANKKGTDGIIHISPFTCMPEIVSQNIFPTMREDCNIPILALIMDEQTGRAGFVTRLEAFVDLMRRRKRRIQTV